MAFSKSPRLIITDDRGQKFSDGKIKAMIDQTALKALPTPEDVAEQVKTLALSRSITGQNIVVDCGIAI